MSEELKKDVLTVDDIDTILAKVNMLQPRMKPINGHYWWAKDRNSQWVPVVDESKDVHEGE